jgi:hypothetical protein
MSSVDVRIQIPSSNDLEHILIQRTPPSSPREVIIDVFYLFKVKSNTLKKRVHFDLERNTYH